MVEALTLHALQSEIQERYEHDEQRVVGIMLARYDMRYKRNSGAMLSILAFEFKEIS